MEISYVWHLIAIIALLGPKYGRASSASEDNLGSGDNWDFWWTYSGISGPSYWGLLNPDWSMCHKGRKQSPIDIDPNYLEFDRNLKPLHVDKKYMSGLMYNDGHAIIFFVDGTLANSKNKDGTSSGSDGSSMMTTTTTTTRANNNTNDQTYIITANSLAQNQNTNQQQKQQEQLQSLSPPPSSVDAFVKSISDRQTDHPSVNHQFAKATATLELEKEFLPILTVSSSSSDLKQQLGSISSQSVDYDLANEDKLDGDNGKGQTEGSDDMPMLNNPVEFSGAGLAYTYRFSMLFIRFGMENNAGSEHRIAGKSFAAEIQILAYNNKLYQDYREALTKPSGLLGVSILVDLSTNTTSDSLNILLESAKKVNHRGKQVELEHFDVGTLLTDPLNFITYEGSLTYPGCQESVTWILLNRPLYIVQSQLDELRRISADESFESAGNMIANDFRTPQPLNDRLIRASINQHQNLESCRRTVTKYEYSYGGVHSGGSSSR